MDGATITRDLLVEYLIRYSSEYHKVSILDIQEYFCNKIYYLADEDDSWNDTDIDSFDNINLNDEEFDEEGFIEYHNLFNLRETAKGNKVKQNLQNRIVTQIQRLLSEDIDKRIHAGFYIRCSCKNTVNTVIKKNKKNEDVIEKSLNVENTERVFYIEGPFEEMHINMLRDALEAFPYAEHEITEKIIDKLNSLTPVYNRSKYDKTIIDINKLPQTTYYDNLHTITKAFSKIKTDNTDETINIGSSEKKLKRKDFEERYLKKVNKIKFTYYEYDESKQLKIKKLRNGITERKVNPVKIMWVNGYYYLVTAIRKKGSKTGDNEFIFINYRIDRMAGVSVCDEPADIPENFDSAEYRAKHPVMYVKDKIRKIEILCDRTLINHALDTFGFDIQIVPLPNDQVKITIENSTHTGVKMWALEYGHKCEILSPPSLREEMRQAAEHLMEIYASK